MTVERGPGVTYIWYDAMENPLEDIMPWTEAAQKIRDITRDVMGVAIANAPVGRRRIDGQTQTIKGSHYQAAGIQKRGKWYSQVIGNRAPHAYYVHEGTLAATGRPIAAVDSWYGPVPSDGGPGGVLLADPPKNRRSIVRSTMTGSATWRAYRGYVYFEHYVFRGQKPQPWLARAGQAAYRMPGNH
jgi:hypothetical protein